jgi:hypothetical protein
VTTPNDAPAKAARPVFWGALLAASLLVVLVIWFGRACWGGWWVLDLHVQPDTYVLGTIYERWAAQVGAGHLPLWFREFAAGTPVHAAWMYGLFYPPLALFLALPPEAAWTWLGIAHVLFGAVGMYAFLWHERRDVAAAASGAVVFATSGFVLGRLLCGHVNLVMPFAWSPWVLLAAARVVHGGRGAWAALGLCAGVGLLAGHVQIWFYVGPLVAAFALVETARLSAWRTATPRLLGGAALALGVAAVQWAPAWELFVVTAGAKEARVDVERCSAPISALVAQIAPWLASSAAPFAHEYLGLSGPLAVAAALLAFRPRDGRRRLWFVVLVLGLVMATGLRTAPGSWAYELPPFCWARTPARALTLVVLAGSVLAGHAVADLLGAASAKIRLLAPVAFLASALIFGVQAPEVIRSDFHDVDWPRALPAGTTDHRVHVEGLRYPLVEARGVRTLRDVCPRDAYGFKMLLNAHMPAKAKASWFDVGAVLEETWWDPQRDAAAVAAATAGAVVRPDAPGGAAQFFPDAARVDSFQGVLDRLCTGEHALWIDETTRDVAAGAPSAGPHAVVQSPTASPGALSFDVEPKDGGWLLVSEKWYPGWASYRDGAGWTPVARGNLAFIAVPAAEAGRIEYRPAWLLPAGLATLASLAGAVVIVVRGRRPR